MRDKADTYCGKCIKADVCGMEGVYDPAKTYCAYKVEVRPHVDWEYLKELIIDVRDADGSANQKETCQYILNLMKVIEKEGGNNE